MSERPLQPGDICRILPHPLLNRRCVGEEVTLIRFVGTVRALGISKRIITVINGWEVKPVDISKWPVVFNDRNGKPFKHCVPQAALLRPFDPDQFMFEEVREVLTA